MQYFDFFRRMSGFSVAGAAFFLLYLAQLAAAEENRLTGKFVLEQTIKSVAAIKTIESDIRMDVFVDGIEFSARGRYEEQAVPKPAATPFLRSMYRLDVNFLSDVPAAPGSERNRMTLVCHLDTDREKNQIWQYTSIEGTKTLNAIKISLLEDAVKRSGKLPYFGSVSEVRNLGGLAAQLKQLAVFYDFDTLQKDTGKDNVWKITGAVRKEHFDKLIARFGGIDKKKRYPSDFPSDAEIWIGRDDFFPYKIIYYNRPSENSPKRNILYRSSYFNTKLNSTEIPPEMFATFEEGEYPDGVFGLLDITAVVIRSLGLR
ncbi:MAG: hypothetical protein LBN39_03995 [Planctomycetaceae bacterium]|jgi:hypothetical protein|nr:hypothetical protein [Planctomycetaceae bacterium]